MSSDRDDHTFVELWKGQRTPETMFEPDGLKSKVQRARTMESWRRRLHIAAVLGGLIYWASRLLFDARVPAVFLWLVVGAYIVNLVTYRPPASSTGWPVFSLLHPPEPPPCIEFYRRELDAWNKAYRPRIGFSIVTVLCGIAMLLATGKRPEVTHPMGLCLIVFGVLWALWLRSRAQVLRKELASLAAYMTRQAN